MNSTAQCDSDRRGSKLAARRLDITLAAALVWLAAAGGTFAEDDTAVVRAAFAKLQQAQNHTFELTTAGKAFVSKVTGKTEKDGWSACTQTTTNGTFDFVFHGTKSAIKTSAGWETQEDLTNPNRATPPPDPRPMRSEYLMLTHRKLPAEICADLLDKVGAFARDGDNYKAELTPEALKQMVPAGDGAPKASASGEVRIWLKDAVVAKFKLSQSLTFDGKTTIFGFEASFTEIGSSKVEIPQEAKERLLR